MLFSSPQFLTRFGNNNYEGNYDMSNTNLNLTKLRCMNLLLRLSGNLKSVNFPEGRRKDAEEALEEFKRLSDSLFTYTTDEEFEPSRENISGALDSLEQAIEETTPLRVV